MPLPSVIDSTAIETVDSTATAVVDSTTTAITDSVPAVSDSVFQSIPELIDKFSSMSGEEIVRWGMSGLLDIGSKILLAVIVYVVGRWIIKRLVKILNKLFSHKSFDVSLNKFIISLVSISLSAVLILSVIGILGINTSAFLAIFASAGLAVGMALSGTLQNFAGGVLILFLKPFKIGDVIEAQGYIGTVKEISLFSTLLNTIDNKMIIIPNGPLSTEVINNYSKEETRRVDWLFGVSYGTDYDKVKAVIEDVVGNNDKVLKDIDLVIILKSLSDSSVDVEVRAWCQSADYWTLYFEVNEAIYKRFNADGIEFPFPQMDVHLNDVTKK